MIGKTCGSLGCAQTKLVATNISPVCHWGKILRFEMLISAAVQSPFEAKTANKINGKSLL